MKVEINSDKIILDDGDFTMPAGEFAQLPVPFLKNWIKALRNGEYGQAGGCLYRKGSYCCLGVAAKVQNYSDDILDEVEMLNDLPNLVRVPKMLRESEGLNIAFARLNDSEHTFKEIADVIETIAKKLEMI